MTKYVCHRCGKIISPEELNLMPGSKCPDCGHRILLKTRPPIIKKLKAR
ncbi:MAG: DNA-directed RNA polymerase subunit P [Candidatus Heimdallarchaeota archaeon]